MGNSTFEGGYDVLTVPERAYAFVLMDGKWVPAALVAVDLAGDSRGRPVYSFAYGRSWRARPDAFAIDPVNLPLDGDIAPQPRPFGALMDAGPDWWGKRLLADRFARLQDEAMAERGIQQRQRHLSVLDTCLLAGEDRVGALSFGPTPERPLLHPATVAIQDIAVVERRMEEYDAGLPVEREITLLAAGTSLGGARPKATVCTDDGTQWLAKFRRPSTDTIDIVRVEHAAMTLARKAGIDVAETRVAPMGVGREALLVRRFDREGDVRLPFSSALTVLGLSDTDLGGSYMQIADRMRIADVGCAPADLAELFRRMVFNVAMGNTDDHLKNHALLRGSDGWHLSPAYDVLPCLDGADYQAISVGRLGSTASWANVMSEHGRFGLTSDEAEAICHGVTDVVSGWQEHFAACGVGEADIRRLGRCIGRLAPPPAPSAAPRRP